MPQRLTARRRVSDLYDFPGQNVGGAWITRFDAAVFCGGRRGIDGAYLLKCHGCRLQTIPSRPNDAAGTYQGRSVGTSSNAVSRPRA